MPPRRRPAISSVLHIVLLGWESPRQGRSELSHLRHMTSIRTVRPLAQVMSYLRIHRVNSQGSLSLNAGGGFGFKAERLSPTE